MMALLGPMGMIFVPSVGGISHSPKELTHWEDCAAAPTSCSAPSSPSTAPDAGQLLDPAGQGKGEELKPASHLSARRVHRGRW